VTFDFVKTLTNAHMNFSFELVNSFDLIANKIISVSYDATSIFDGISQALLKI